MAESTRSKHQQQHQNQNDALQVQVDKTRQELSDVKADVQEIKNDLNELRDMLLHWLTKQHNIPHRNSMIEKLMKQKCRKDQENPVISEEFSSKKLEEGEASTDSVEEVQKSALDEENGAKDEVPMYNSSDSGGSTLEASSRSLLKTDLEPHPILSVKEDQLDINIGITLKDKETLKAIEDSAAVNRGEKSLVESHDQAADEEVLKAAEEELLKVAEMEKKMILSGNNGTVFERRVTEFSLGEFLCNGPLREPNKERNSLLRKIKDGKILKWEVDIDDPLGTRQRAFQQVEPILGVNLENVENLKVIFEPFDRGRERNLVETDVLSFHSKSVRALKSLQLYRTGAFPNGFQRFFQASRPLIVRCEASNGRTTQQDFTDMAWQANVSFQDLESYAFFDMDGNQTPQDLVIAGGKHISLDSNSSFYRDSRAKYIIEGIFDKSESLYTSVVIFGGEKWESSMGLQVLLDKNLTPQIFDVLPLKVVFRPFDRGRERTPVGINCNGQGAMDELGMISNGGALRWLGVLIWREFLVEDLLIILENIFASVNGKLDKGAEEDIESSLNSPQGAFISATTVSMFLYLRSYLPTTELILKGCLAEHCSPDDVDSCNGNQNLRGLAIVTCCHHLVYDKVTLKILMDSENMVEILTVLWFTASMVEVQACRISGLGVQIFFLKSTWTVNKRQLPQRLSFAHSMIFQFDSSCLMLANVQVVKSVSNGHLLQLRYLALTNLAIVFLQQGSAHYEDASRCYLQAVEINTIDSVVWNQLGTISCSMELFSISRWAFEQGPSCRPYNWNGIEKLLEVNDFSVFYCSSLRPNGKAMIESRFRGLLNHSMSLLKKEMAIGYT